ncbi:hypothetical protein [Candidatus Lucifugimonas marina]|jgi:hypothetical protein|uniref:DUF948 domain-containing protein n=1 Tax=Candidatus Lucifugimonas marina TaxID=3038979 RepID=A0AAJ5ZBI3_9CHLR|nr:hypothetical protein [SAR202 cluster bacterium JH702]MDG0869660.1 hypothetical protein [SAR202 cluster bacterium JH639]WFG34393.1 hypothetical protein GKN94_01420 [SAR202 cluster bacterium JH545]WFG38322.1 hypothetical protein GKO48_01435 [SAR202 cluster bacterium JH1073]
MTTSENIAQIKDIVLIVFLVFSFVLLLFGAVLSLRLYGRVNRFMDRMEHVAEGFEETFGRVAVARRTVEEAASALKPVAKGLGLIGAFQGVSRLFGGGSSESPDSENK